MPTIPLSGRQTLAVLGIALVTAAFTLTIYHYATRQTGEAGA